jgi:hypothetical protein
VAWQNRHLKVEKVEQENFFGDDMAISTIHANIALALVLLKG